MLSAVTPSVALSALLLTSPAFADVYCTGPINFLGADSTGTIWVDVGYGVWGVCNLSAPLTIGSITVTTDACKGWYASLLAVQRAGTTAEIVMHGTTGCTTYGSWMYPGNWIVVPQ
jgi:hypothetical protein